MINTDPDYLRKASISLRQKLSLPLRVYNPSFDNLHAASDVQRVDDKVPQDSLSNMSGYNQVNVWSPQVIKPISPAPSQYNHEKRGTRSGPYEGHASGRWLEKEFRLKIDSLAAAVDKAVSDRGSLVQPVGNKSDLDLQHIELTRLVQEQQKKIADLSLLVPTADDGHKALRRELADLEADADYYYSLYKSEEKEKLEVQRQKDEMALAMETALSHLSQLQIDFNVVKSQLESFTSRENAMIEEANRRNELGLHMVPPAQMMQAPERLMPPSSYGNVHAQRSSWCMSCA